MGLSVAASSAILFVGFMVVATALFAVINMTILDIEEKYKLATDHQSDEFKTTIRVDNATNNTTTVFINITNTGSNLLHPSELQVLINGSLVTSKVKTRMVAGIVTTDIWAPDEKLYLEVTFKVKAGQRVTVITGNGVSDSGVLT